MKQILLLLFIISSLNFYSQVLVNETFDGGVNPPSGWSFDAHEENWSIESTNVAGGTAPELRMTSEPTFSGRSRLISPSFDTTGSSTLIVKLDYSIDHSSGTYTVGVATRSDGGTWHTEWAKLGTNITESKTIEINNDDVGSSDFQFCVYFNGPSANIDYFYVDNIQLIRPLPIDLAMQSINTESMYGPGPVYFNTSFVNLGDNAITNFTLNYQVDDEDPVDEEVNGLNLSFNQTDDYTFSTPWEATAGIHEVTIWATNINGSGDDDNMDNNSITKQVSVANEVFPKRVVYEEATGTWCGWCVRGHVGLKDMDYYHDDGSWIGVAVHNSDPMENSEYDNEIGNFIGGYPSGLINRNPEEVDPATSTLQSAYDIEVEKLPAAKVDISNQSWDESTREVTFDVDVNFAADLSNADYNIAVIVTEDNVTGTSSGYDQVNYYYTNGIDIIDWEGINWRNLGNPIPAEEMVYAHVGRELLGGWDGVTGAIPNNVVYGTTYTEPFDYTVPTNYNEDEISFVAILIDNSTGEIENAEKVHLDSTVGYADTKNDFDFKCYPNPSSGIFKISTPNKVDLTIFNPLGQIVKKLNNITENSSIDISDLINGVYYIKATQEGLTAVDTVIINH
jgi:hypothetical protein